MSKAEGPYPQRADSQVDSIPVNHGGRGRVLGMWVALQAKISKSQSANARKA